MLFGCLEDLVDIPLLSIDIGVHIPLLLAVLRAHCRPTFIVPWPIGTAFRCCEGLVNRLAHHLVFCLLRQVLDQGLHQIGLALQVLILNHLVFKRLNFRNEAIGDLRRHFPFCQQILMLLLLLHLFIKDDTIEHYLAFAFINTRLCLVIWLFLVTHQIDLTIEQIKLIDIGTVA